MAKKKEAKKATALVLMGLKAKPINPVKKTTRSNVGWTVWIYSDEYGWTPEDDNDTLNAAKSFAKGVLEDSDNEIIAVAVMDNFIPPVKYEEIEKE